MKQIRIFLSILAFLAAASAAEITVKVIDPRSRPVTGAQIEFLSQHNGAVLSVQTTSAEGTAVFHSASPSRPRIRVLAVGFAAADASSESDNVTVQLRLAPVAQTVVVTATRTPATADSVDAQTATLDAAQLLSMRPVSANDGMRFLPGAVIATQGRRGGLGSLFVRGGDSRYNKVIVDGVAINEPGGTFDFGVLPLAQADRIEFVRGAQSVLYGSDAMTSTVQVFTRNGNTSTPELRFGADGGNFGTANGYASLAGARGRFDYNVFGDQFNTEGQGINDNYSDSTQGGNLGMQLSDRVAFRLRARHANAFSGVQNEWKFNGAELMPPDSDQWARQNNFLASGELTVSGPSGWQHRVRGFEYRHQRTNVDAVNDPGRIFDTPFHSVFDGNRAGLDYQGDYFARSWARTTVGYQFEDENGFVGDANSPPLTHGLRRNHAVYGQEVLTLNRVSIIGGARFVHNETFGNKVVPRIATSFLAARGGHLLSGTRLTFSYATGIKEARFDEAFAKGPFIIPNPNLKAEENRAFETGFQQGFWDGKYSLSATYFNNLFRHQIDFAILDFTTFTGQYENIDKSMAHGAEVELHGRPRSHVSFDLAYNYTSTQILEQPFAFDALHAPGQPLLRRPKHSGSALVSYLGRRWGANLGCSVVGRRLDSDFLGFNIDHAAGYARVDVGGWYAINSRVTAYANVENALDHYYEEVVGYPALGVNVRAGMRFRIGGE